MDRVHIHLQIIGTCHPSLEKQRGKEENVTERDKERKGKKRKGEKIERWIEERKRKTEKLKAERGFEVNVYYGG